MYNSILHFIENDIREIENLVAAMLKGEEEPHNLSQHIHDRIMKLRGQPDCRTGECRFVLDKFHMMKYVIASVSHLLDSAEEVKGEICKCLNGRYIIRLKRVYTEILKITEVDDEVKGSLVYYTNQRDGIQSHTKEAGTNWKCCAEG